MIHTVTWRCYNEGVTISKGKCSKLFTQYFSGQCSNIFAPIFSDQYVYSYCDVSNVWNGQTKHILWVTKRNFFRDFQSLNCSTLVITFNWLFFFALYYLYLFHWLAKFNEPAVQLEFNCHIDRLCNSSFLSPSSHHNIFCLPDRMSSIFKKLIRKLTFTKCFFQYVPHKLNMCWESIIHMTNISLILHFSHFSLTSGSKNRSLVVDTDVPMMTQSENFPQAVKSRNCDAIAALWTISLASMKPIMVKLNTNYKSSEI